MERVRRPRVTSLRAFGAAFVLLVGGVLAVAVAQLFASSTAAWASLACSAGSVASTAVSIVLRDR